MRFNIREACLVLGVVSSIVTIILAINGNLKFSPYAFHIFLGVIALIVFGFYFYDYIIVRKEKYETIFFHIKWIMIDENRSIYDIVRVIKSNRPYLGMVEFKHTWTGCGEAEITSEELVTTIKDLPSITINYPVALFLNEIKAIHYTIETVDNSGKQSNQINCGGTRPIDMLILEAVIQHDRHPETAKVLVSAPHAQKCSAKEVKRVQFNSQTRAYRWEMKKFPGGSVYWLDWNE